MDTQEPAMNLVDVLAVSIAASEGSGPPDEQDHQWAVAGLTALRAHAPEGATITIAADGTLGWLEATAMAIAGLRNTPHVRAGYCDAFGCDPLYVIREVEG